MGKHRRYRIGIDVGLYSVGLAAVEIDDSSDNPYEAMPIDFLSVMSVVHDGAIDPSKQKSADSRKAVSGVARRTRRLFARRQKRYQVLDSALIRYGYPVAQACEMASSMHDSDPYLPWRARVSLVDQRIDNPVERKLAITIALRHIARHRGWRNPYSSIDSLAERSSCASSFYLEFFNKQQRWLIENGKSPYPGVEAVISDDGSYSLEGVPHWEEPEVGRTRPTIAELVSPLLSSTPECRIRSDKEDPSKTLPIVHMGKLHQCDNFYELQRIFDTQGVPEKEQKEFFSAVFRQTNPKEVGAAAALVAKDDLQPTKPRAAKASLAFQRYRILTTIANLRIKQDGNNSRALTDEERKGLYAFLVSAEASHQGSDLSWHDVARVLDIERNDLVGVGGQTADGFPISAKQPPFLNTEHAILASKEINKRLKPLKEWWTGADNSSKEILIEMLGNAGVSEAFLDEEGQRAKAQVDGFLAGLGSFSEESLLALEKITLVPGRAAYSVETLERLNKRMLEEGLDLFEARKKEFGVENDWHPKPEPLGTPTGNPAVDRTIKIAARWLKACEREWGKPETVFIEHVRDGFKTEKQKRDEQSGMDRRFKANQAVRREIIAALDEQEGSGSTGGDALRLADVRRWQAIQRQNNQCLYCGGEITFRTAQMDHIVPRKGVGCSNELPNLVAVCADCNVSKNHTLFRTWAGPERRQKAVERVKLWNRDSYFASDKQFKAFQSDVMARLKQKEEDEPLDSRSIESVAWMARALREQVVGHFGYQGIVERATEGTDPFSLQRVHVFKGWITAEARKASGLEKALPWLGSSSEKTRLDRRHHAVDASVVALMRPAVAKTLVERDALRREMRDTGQRFEKDDKRDWRKHQGSTPEDTATYVFWRDAQMQRLRELLATCMREDRIAIVHPLRLRMEMGRAHEDTVSPLLKRKVGQALSAEAIDKAETPALWTALTSDSNFNEATGLPEDANRCINVHGRTLQPTDFIGFMAGSEEELNVVKDAVYTRVRGGYSAIGCAIHHARIYRIPKCNRKGAQTGWQYAMLRVFQQDLLKQGKKDLFSVSLPLCSVSVRSAIPALRAALRKGTAQYLGWLVVGDEMVADLEEAPFNAQGIQKMDTFMKAFPEARRFTITGFGTNAKLRIAPRLLSSEGIPDIDWDRPDALKMAKRTYGNHDWTKADIDAVNCILENGYLLSIEKVCANHPAIIRRNTLSVPRWNSNSNMPTCWRIPPHPCDF